MATATISIDDALLAQVQQAAGDDLSGWIATACLSRLLRQGVESARAWEQQHPAQAGAARAEDARHVLEAEAEREIDAHAHTAAAQARGVDARPTTEDYLAAYGHVRVLLERAEQQLRGQQSHEGEQ
ncbi:hypothetical protein ACFVMC_13940 [Nocardia sp. NPDC127579]|uniref:hypothetical protein n=1 Tax=Nocardia sp. NPDC127579 TaxID=3345402 RepID=UPI0036424A9D